MKETIEFTPREKMLINYYRDRHSSGGSRTLVYHLSFAIVPLLCAGFFFWGGDDAWIYVGYALLLYRAGQSLWSDFLTPPAWRASFEKYEARLKELESAQKGSE